MQWFRLYDDLLDDPKAQKLSGNLFKHWINLLCLANKASERGTLPDVSDIAFRLRLSVPKTEALIRELEAAGLIDRHESGMTPHNWHERQKRSDDVTARTTKHKQERLRERSQEHDQPVLDTDTDTEESRGEENTVVAETAKRPPAKKRLPEDWQPGDDLIAYGIGQGFTEAQTRDYLESFRLYFQSRGTPMLKWDQAAQGWLRKERERKPHTNGNGGGPKGPNFAEIARQLRAQEAGS